MCVTVREKEFGGGEGIRDLFNSKTEKKIEVLFFL